MLKPNFNPGDYPPITIQELWSLLGEKECLIYQLKKAVEQRDLFISQLIKENNG